MPRARRSATAASSSASFAPSRARAFAFVGRRWRSRSRRAVGLAPCRRHTRPQRQPSAPPRLRARTSTSARRPTAAASPTRIVGRGPPLVKAANWLNHLEYDWQSPIWSHLLHALAADHRLDPLRRARQRAVRLGGRRHLVRRLRARPRKRGRCSRPRAVCAARHFAGLRGFDCLCRAPSRARRATLCSMAASRAAAASAARQRGNRAGRRAADADARRAGARRIRHSGRSSRRCSFPAARPSRCSGSTTCSA